MLTQTAASYGSVPQEEIMASYNKVESARRRLFDEIHKDTRAAIDLGIPEGEVYDALVSGNVGKDMAKRIINGDYEPYRFSRQMQKAIERANPEEAAERIGALPAGPAGRRQRRPTRPRRQR